MAKPGGVAKPGDAHAAAQELVKLSRAQSWCFWTWLPGAIKVLKSVARKIIHAVVEDLFLWSHAQPCKPDDNDTISRSTFPLTPSFTGEQHALGSPSTCSEPVAADIGENEVPSTQQIRNAIVADLVHNAKPGDAHVEGLIHIAEPGNADVADSCFELHPISEAW